MAPRSLRVPRAPRPLTAPKAPRAPRSLRAPMDIHIIAVNDKKGCKFPGAKYSPHILVKIAKAITLGFSNEM